jgi:hypothetical protein
MVQGAQTYFWAPFSFHGLHGNKEKCGVPIEERSGRRNGVTWHIEVAEALIAKSAHQESA